MPLIAIKLTPDVYSTRGGDNRLAFDLTVKNVGARDIRSAHLEIQKIGAPEGLYPWDDVAVNLKPGESRTLVYPEAGRKPLPLQPEIKKMAVYLWTVGDADGQIAHLPCLVGSEAIPEASKSVSPQDDDSCSGPYTLCLSAADSDRDFAVFKGEYLINAKTDYWHRNGYYYRSQIKGRAVISICRKLKCGE